MRTVYLGTSAFAVAVLRRLADSPHRPALVVKTSEREAAVLAVGAAVERAASDRAFRDVAFSVDVDPQ